MLMQQYDHLHMSCTLFSGNVMTYTVLDLDGLQTKEQSKKWIEIFLIFRTFWAYEKCHYSVYKQINK